jgi:hypothetical protein
MAFTERRAALLSAGRAVAQTHPDGLIHQAVTLLATDRDGGIRFPFPRVGLPGADAPFCAAGCNFVAVATHAFS